MREGGQVTVRIGDCRKGHRECADERRLGELEHAELENVFLFLEIDEE